MAEAKNEDVEEKFVRIPTYSEYGFHQLHSEVIKKNACCLCGTCIAFCEKITEKNGTPDFIEDYDTVCGMCYTFCPRTFLPLDDIEEKIFGMRRGSADCDEKENLGIYRGCYAVRARDEEITRRAQDGGAVTALLSCALDGGMIDCAVTTAADDEWNNRMTIARSREELIKSAGTKYVMYPGVVGIREAIEKEKCENIGFTGVPCQIQALRKIQTLDEPYEIGREKIKLLIGLFCMESFEPTLMTFLRDSLEIDIRELRKLDIKKNELIVEEKNGRTHKISLSRIKEFARTGCLICRDFTAELADISVGSVGSPDGWSTVLPRTEIGEKLVDEASRKGYVDVREIRIDAVNRIAKLKKGRGDE